MYANNAIGIVILLRTAICVLVMGLISAAAAEEETDVLKITVGQPTLMSKLRYQNTAAVAVSRTGAVAAFYPKPGEGAKYYRISNDGGRTWGEELDFPPAYVGPMTVGRRGGGVLAMLDTSPVEGGPPDQLTCTRIIFSDDFLTFEEGISAVSIPNVVKHNKWGTRWPGFGIGKIVQLDNGDLLGTMHGNLRGDDNWYRTMVLRSTDEGENWEFHASIAFSLDDPHPQLVGSYCGYCEPSLALLSNGQLLCIMRTQGAQYAGEYRPLYQCWSDDLGETWTEPVLSQPFLMNIAPTLAVLDNGVVVCRYGRPGFHVAFSLDHGHTWQDRIRFSDLPEPVITGQFEPGQGGREQYGRHRQRPRRGQGLADRGRARQGHAESRRAGGSSAGRRRQSDCRCDRRTEPQSLLSRRLAGTRDGYGPLEGHADDRRLTGPGISIHSYRKWTPDGADGRRGTVPVRTGQDWGVCADGGG